MASNDYATIEIKGLKELNDALKQLPDRIAKNVLRGATGAGAAIIRGEMRARAPVYTGDVQQGHPAPGTLKRAVYMKQIREKSSDTQQTFYVGVRHGKDRQSVGKKQANLDAFYFSWVEFGTSKMPARPYMRPAFEAQKTAAAEAVKAYLAKRIPLEADKLKQGPKP